MASSCIKIRVSPSVFEISPCGDIDSSNASLLEEAIWIAGTHHRPLTYLDFRDLNYLSTAGIGQILTAVHDLLGQGDRLRIGRCPAGIADTLTQVGLGDLLTDEHPHTPNDRQGDGLYGLIVPSELDELRNIRTYIEKAFTEMDTSRADYYGLMMAVDELCSNVIRHNYEGRVKGPVAVMLSRRDGILEISVIDKGFQFDPTQHQSRPVEQTVHSGRTGGLGIPLVSMLTDKVAFSRQEGHNITQLSKLVVEPAKHSSGSGAAQAMRRAY